MFRNKELQKNFLDFLKIYSLKPIKDNTSGVKIEHAFALFMILKKIKPKYVIESGVSKGMSTWIIEKALPKSKIFCLEPNIDKIEYFSKQAIYKKKDITKIKWNKLNKNKTLIFFDDHVCLSKRINFLLENKFKHITFDDNLTSNAISYITPQTILKNKYINPKVRLNYLNFSRIIKLFFNYFKEKKKYSNFLFKKNYMEFEKNEYDEKKIFLCRSFKKLISNYYEFPPILKFNFKIKFSTQIEKYGIDCENFMLNVPKPIFPKSFKQLSIYRKEISKQYGSFCYFKIKKGRGGRVVEGARLESV